MLTLQRLELENFGPYLGRQVVEFPEHGVTVIHGRNGTGKTSLLNAIRYALYGKALGRQSLDRSFRSISNREQVRTGDYSFKVVLTFVFDGEPHELTRACRPRRGIEHPREDSDYEQEVVLRVGHQVQGAETRDGLIARILPEEVARFFLFDGELLQEYEQLLLDDSDSGRRISQEIERILGLPFLQRGEKHLQHLADEATKELSREGKKHEQTKAASEILDGLQEYQDRRKTELANLQAERAQYDEDLRKAEEYLEQHSRNERLLEQRRSAEESARDAHEAEQAALDDLREVMKDAWRGLASEAAARALSDAESQAKRALEDVTLSLRSQAVSQGHCDICDRGLAREDAQRLSETLTLEPGASRDTERVLAAASDIVGRVATLSRFRDADRSGEISRLWSDIEINRMKAKSAKDKIQEIDSSADSLAEQKVVEARQAQRTLVRKLDNTDRGIDETKEKLSDLARRISETRSQIEATGATETTEIQARVDLLQGSAEVFHEAIAGYREDLRKRVEADSTDYFMKMIARSNYYQGLQINEAFGLQIVHADGRLDDARSSGQEHVVALALMAALQRNAPIGGPIVMDSPFFRLDDGHKASVIKALPDMADQAILLVYDGEIDDDVLRDSLGGKLAKEYWIESVSGHESKILRDDQ